MNVCVQAFSIQYYWKRNALPQKSLSYQSFFVFPIYRYCKRDGVESFSLVEFLEGGEPASVRKESCNLKPILLAALGATGRAWLRDVHLQNAQGSESKKKEIIIKLIQIQTAGKNKYVSFSLITIKIYKNISDNLTYFLFKHIL